MRRCRRVAIVPVVVATVPPISSDAKPMWGGNRVFPGNFGDAHGRFGMFHDRENPSNLRMCMERVHLGAYSMYAWWKIARDSHWEFGAECVEPGESRAPMSRLLGRGKNSRSGLSV